MSPPCCRIRCKDCPASGKPSSLSNTPTGSPPTTTSFWWIPSESRAGARQALADLATRLDLGSPAAETGELIRAVLDALRMGQPYQRWLLIFDNAGAPDDIRSLLLSGPGHTLVSSRNQSWVNQADVLDVDVYEREESTEFLHRRLRELSLPDSDRLAAELGDLPLALEHAAGWLSTTRLTTDDYLSLLREHISELFDPARPRDYPVSVRATWTVSMNRLREQNPEAEKLLNLCAFIGPDPIPLGLLTTRPPEAMPATLRVALSSPVQRGRILSDIRSYSLARVSESASQGPFAGPALQQHRLVQAVARDVASAAERESYRRLAHQLLADADPGDPELPANWPTYAALLPHVLSSEAFADTDPDVRRLTLNEARALWRRGEFRTCLNLVTEAAKAWSPALDETDPDLLLASRERSNALHGLGRFGEALHEDRAVYDRLAGRVGPITLTRSGRPACSPAAAAGWGTSRPRGSWTTTPSWLPSVTAAGTIPKPYGLRTTRRWTAGWRASSRPLSTSTATTLR